MHIKTLIVHPKGSKIELPGAVYVPVTQPDGHQVFEVTNEAHIKRLLAIKEGFAEYVPGEPPPAPAATSAGQASDDLALLGSAVHPAEFKIGARTYALGEVVQLAFTASGLDPAAWNALDDEARHAAIDAELDKLEPEQGGDGGADAPPNFAIMRKPELEAYVAAHLPGLKLGAKTPLMALRKQVAKAAADAKKAA